jgi:hypothetical protein
MMFCTHCKTLHETRQQCPTCGERLISREGWKGSSSKVTQDRGWRQTTWGRILIGILLAQGLLFGAHRLLSGLVLGFLPEGQSAGELPQVVLLYQGVQILTLLIACVLAAGGQRQGFFIGMAIGAFHGTLAVLLQPTLDTNTSAISMVGLPLIQGVFGAVGGWVGCTFWKPVPMAHFPTALLPARTPKRPPHTVPVLSGKIPWFRALLGVSVAVAGALSAAPLFDRLMDLFGGRLTLVYSTQDLIVIWEIRILAFLTGGALAGVNSFNGIKQGLVVAVGTATILLGMQISTPGAIDLITLLMITPAFALSLVGSWFGSQLLPPVVRLPRRREFGAASL